MKTKKNVYFFLADQNIDLVTAINNGNGNVLCLVTGNAAYRKGLQIVKDNEVLYQVKITVNQTEILYRY